MFLFLKILQEKFLWHLKRTLLDKNRCYAFYQFLSKMLYAFGQKLMFAHFISFVQNAVLNCILAGLKALAQYFSYIGNNHKGFFILGVYKLL